MISFCDLSGLINFINVLTCYKVFDNPTSIDIIKTNLLLSYLQHITAFEISVSDFHVLTITEFKTSFQK